MSWYSQMFKSYEVARERNRRIQKRLQVELGQKHGPQFVAQYRNSEVNREQKLIEKELERIRKGIHKKPKHGGDSHLNSSRNPNTDSTPGSHVLTVVSPRQQRHSLAFPQTFREFESDIDTKPSAEENQLFQAIILLQTNPSALVPILNAHAQSKAYLDTLERISPRLSPDCQKHFLPRNISKADSATSSERAMLRNKYETLLQRKHSFLKLTKSKKKRKKSPLLLRNKQGVARNDKPVSKTATIVVDPPTPETRVQETNTVGDLPNIETRVKEKPTADDLPNIESRLKENPDIVDLPNIQTRDHHSTAIEDDTVLPLPGDVEQIYVPPGDDIALGDDDKCEKALTSDDVVDMLNFDPETDHIVDHRLLATGSALNSDTPIWERQFAEREHSTPVPRSSDFRPPALYPGDQMQNSREPPRRQSSSDKAPLERKSSQSADDDMGPDGYSAIKARPALDKRISANKLMFPPPDAEMYNPDGSKRTVHNLPDFDASYGEARKARYCRTREMQERDRELSLNEIFDK